MTIAGWFSLERLLIALCLTLVLVVCPSAPAGAPARDAEPPEDVEGTHQAPAEPLVAPWDEPGDEDPAKPPEDATRGTSVDEPAMPTISGPRDLLRGHGIDDQQLDGFADGRPLGDAEFDTLHRILYWMVRDFPVFDVEGWARADWSVAGLAENPDAGRGQIYAFSGRVTLAEARPLDDKDAKRFETKRYYRCELLLEDGQPAVVFTRDVPKAWSKNEPIDEPVGAFGLFLKFGPKKDGRPIPVFAAARIAWYPDTLLGNLGMDAGLLESVVNGSGLGARRKRKKLVGITEEEEIARARREREAFYAVLATVGRIKPGQLRRQAGELLERAPPERKTADGKEFSVVSLFNQPKQQRGRLFVLEGVARSVTRVPVDDPDIVARFGINHYYEIAVFTGDSQDNPIFFCVRDLPEGMPTGDRPEFAERVRVAGFFFKTWAYKMEVPGSVSETQWADLNPGHLAPLLIGRRPFWYRPGASAANPWIGAIAGGLFVLALLGVWVALWRYGRGDKEFHDRTIAKTHALESGISLNEIGLNADGSPDFSGLEQMERDAGEKRGETAQRPEND